MAGLQVSYAARRRLRAAGTAGLCLVVGAALGCLLTLSLRGPHPSTSRLCLVFINRFVAIPLHCA